MTNPFRRERRNFNAAGDFLERSAAATKSAAENDDQARSPAAERLRRRGEICATIIMAAAYKGAATVRQQNPRMSKMETARSVRLPLPPCGERGVSARSDSTLSSDSRRGPLPGVRPIAIR